VPAAIPRFRRSRAASKSPFSGNVVLGLAALAVFLSGPGQTYGVSVFIDPILDETGWSRSLIASMYSLATLVSAGGILIAGRLIDRIGNRFMMVVATVAFAAGLAIGSFATVPVVLFIALAMLRTFGSASLTLSARTLVPNWFVRRRGRAFSIVGIASALSLALFPPFGEALIDAFGWRWAWRIESLALIAFFVPAVLLFVRDRPEDVGQHPDGMAHNQPVTPRTASAGDAEHQWTLGQAARLPTFWLLMFAGLVPSLVVTGLAFHQVSIFTSEGLPGSLAATTFTVESSIALPMTLMAGWLSDRFEPRFVLAASQLFLAVAMVFLITADSVAFALAYAAIRGASSGLWNVAADVMWPTYFGRRNLGSIRSSTFAASVVGAAIGPLPLGFVYDRTGDFSVAIAAMLVLPVLGFLAVLVARRPGAPA
jgi:MFS family permease